MPDAWRLSAARWADSAFAGHGSVESSGRWHHAGTRCVYTSATPALAALEVLVHSGGGRPIIPFVIFRVQIPDDPRIEKVHPELLTAGWRDFPAPDRLASFGSKWVERGEIAVLQVPSAVSPLEFNFLLNPVHEEFSKLVISSPEAFEFDSPLLVGHSEAGNQANQ